MAKAPKASEIDWSALGFDYLDLPYRYIAHYKDGQWDQGELTEDSTLHISEGSTALHYGQADFEGLKAYRTKDGEIQLFRPDQNAKRMQRSCARLLMPALSEAQFLSALKSVVKANADYVPPYGTGGTLYLRPLMIGVGGNIGVHPAQEYIFTVFAMPVGAYYKGGVTPTNFTTSYYDRAAPHGTGQNKVGGNYGGSLLPGDEAHKAGFSDVIYLDPATHTKIEEAGSANFFGITKDNEFVTPKSDSILPSITKFSLLYLAEHNLGLKPIEATFTLTNLTDSPKLGQWERPLSSRQLGALNIRTTSTSFIVKLRSARLPKNFTIR